MIVCSTVGIIEGWFYGRQYIRKSVLKTLLNEWRLIKEIQIPRNGKGIIETA
jgi:hypothetical protein